MNREQDLKELYKEVEEYFYANGLIDNSVTNYRYIFKPGMWIKSTDGFEYRFDICKSCGLRYANKRRRGVQYGIHNWWHYCSKGCCHTCQNQKRNSVKAPSSIPVIKLFKKVNGE